MIDFGVKGLIINDLICFINLDEIPSTPELDFEVSSSIIFSVCCSDTY